jgi:protein-tyrosine-phosphatase
VPADATADPVPFHVVFICTGNRARSPLAEALLRAKLGDAARVESYGTLDLGPEPAMPDAIDAAAALGVDLRDHRARSLHSVRLDEADLVVGFELFHVAAAVVEAGASRERSFLIGELATLIDEVSGIGSRPLGPRATVALAHTRRMTRRTSTQALADPYGKSRKVYNDVAKTIDGLTTALAKGLFPGSGPGR